MKRKTGRHRLRDLWPRTSDASLTFLLFSLALLLFVVFPFLRPAGIGRSLIDVLVTFTMISGALVTDRRLLRAAALSVAVGALVTQWAGHVDPSSEMSLWNHWLTLAFLLLATGLVLDRVFRPGRITSHRIQGAVAAYLLLALVFARAFSLIELVRSGSFVMDLGPLGVDTESGTSGVPASVFTYFSIVTLTTVGYGDMTPFSPAARTLCNLESLVGQLYPALLLARLVSLQIADRGTR